MSMNKTDDSREASIVPPVHPAVSLGLKGKLSLYVTLPNKPEGRLATAFESTPEKTYDKLVQERNNWINNGHPEYFNAQYRIGNYEHWW